MYITLEHQSEIVMSAQAIIFNMCQENPIIKLATMFGKQVAYVAKCQKKLKLVWPSLIMRLNLYMNMNTKWQLKKQRSKHTW